MNPFTLSVVGCVLLFVGMLALAAVGRRMGRRRLHVEGNPDALEGGNVDAIVLSLLGLLTAFTFSNAYARFETRRQLVVDEANAIGTARLRLELLPAEAQTTLRSEFHDYIVSRIEFWHLLPDPDAAMAEWGRTTKMQQQIWSTAVDATKDETYLDSRKLLLPALNEMIDITTTRLIAAQSHPPALIFLSLGLLALAAAWLTGYGLAKAERPHLLHVLGLAALTCLALYLIVDIEYPRYGFITLDHPHELFVDLAKEAK